MRIPRAIVRLAIVLLAATWAGIVAVTVVAQVTGVPFSAWPALYSAAEHAVVKRGVDANGQNNDYLYFRIGWGECLGVKKSELNKLYWDAPRDRYIGLRAYAEGKLEEEGAWTAMHAANCPDPSMQVKPYYRGSRPMYEYVENDAGVWVKGKKSAYRILSPKPAVAACTQYNARKADGTATNYWMVEDGTEVYIGEATYLTGFAVLGVRLVTVCEEDDVDILDYRFQ